MTCFDPDRPSGPPEGACPAEAEVRRPAAPASIRLAGPALRTLDRIAEALGIATALLHAGSEPTCDGPASLMEASALLEAFIRIEDPEARQRCLAYVRAAATGGDDA